MIEPAPVILFVYNRPDHTRQTIEALQNNDLAASSTLLVFADGPKPGASEEQRIKIRQTRELFDNCKGFKQVVLKKKEINQGLAVSVIEGVTQVLNEYGKVIVLEDDIVTGKGFLTYMNAGLSLYEEDKDVVSISAYNFPIKANGLSDTFFLRGADCWGWATWKRGWQIFEADAQKLYNKLVAARLTHSFDFDGAYPYTKMLQDQINGKVDSWAIRWHAAAFLANKLTLYPRVSLIKNIGLDGSGTHGENDNAMSSFFADHCTVERIPLQQDNKALSRVRRFFVPSKPRMFINKLIRRLNAN